MKSVERMPLTNQVMNQIKEYIIEHSLSADDKLPTERELVQILDVSRTVVREALRSLEAMGIVRVKAGGGIFVSDSQTDAMIDILTFQFQRGEQAQVELLNTRIVLECGALELCIEHITSEEIAELKAYNEEFRTQVQRGKVPIEEDLKFHQTLFRSTHNSIYYQLTNLIIEFFTRVRTQELSDRNGMLNSAKEHDELIAALQLRDLAEAQRVMKLHLGHLREIVGDTFHA